MEPQNLIIEGIHYATRKVFRLGIRNGYIYSLADIEGIYRAGEHNGVKLSIIAPGLVDLQINGYKGVDFNHKDLAAEQIEAASLNLLKLGITKFFPTLVTGPVERISTLLKTFADVIDQKVMASQMIGGIHLEGPFISRENGPRGAHPREYCIDPVIAMVKKWQEEAKGRIRIITLAPELPGSTDLIRTCVKMGMVVAIGHTAATSDEIRRAVDAGATLSTHLGNGSHTILPRHPNYIWDQLAEDRLFASMIADGFHLPDPVLKVFIRSKKERAILVSDGMPYSGLDPGVYDSPSNGAIRLTEEGKLHLEDHPEILAGSASTLLDGVGKIAELEGFPFAWDMGSVHPSRMLNHASKHGLHVGAPADLVLLDPDLKNLRINRVYKNGVKWDITTTNTKFFAE
jgi:N-acetylglucosamine-6-phosphate deacetylase